MTLKRLNEVMRNPKLYAQTKAIYTYLFVRADHKTDKAFPPKQQMLDEIHLTESLLNQGIAVLEKQGYIKSEVKESIDKETKKPYIYTIYTLLDSK